MYTPIANQAAAEIVKATPVERQIKRETLFPGESAAATPAHCATTVTSTTATNRTTSTTGSTRTARFTSRDEIQILLIARCERAHRRAAQPQIPIKGVGYGGRRWNLRHFLRPTGAARPGVNFLHFANFSRPEDFAGDARCIVGITLIAHLRGDFVF